MFHILISLLNHDLLDLSCLKQARYSSFRIDIFDAAIRGTRTIFNGSKVDIKF